MAGDDDDFHIRLGRSRSQGTRADRRLQPFVKQVQAAVRKAGGNPNRFGAPAPKGSGRFSARGRGAKLSASFGRDNSAWQRDSAGRFRSRRVVVKARVVKLNPQRGARGQKMRVTASKAADVHLRYLGERVYLVIDGVDGRVHHMEFANPVHIDEVRRGMIVEAAPAAFGPRASDRNIAVMAEDNGGLYQPSQHIEGARDILAQRGKDPEAFIRSHVRRLEALRRAGHVERIDADHWRIPKDITERGMAYDLSRGGDGLRVRTLSAFDLERQISSDGATWLDRELVARTPTPLGTTGFGRDVMHALDRRAERLVSMGHATVQTDGSFLLPRNLVATLEHQEVERVGQEMAKARGLTYQPAKTGEYVRGTLAGSTNLASGRYAMIDDGLGFSLVPWQPVLDQRIGRHIAGVLRGDGGIEWDLGRKLGLGL